MKRRVCVNCTEKEKLALLRRWKVDNPDWALEEAAVELGVKESTLRGWVKRYWDVCDKEVGSDRKRNEGGGRKHKMKPYEGRVIEYLDELMEDNWTFDDVMFYCRSLEEFNSDFDIPESQVTWVKRFIQRYTARVPPDDGGVPSTDGGATCGGGGVTRGDDSEHEQDNGVTPGDGAVPFDGCGDEHSDEDSYDSAGSDESDSSSESMDCNESEESEYEVPTAAKKTSLPRRQSATRSRKQKPILEWTRGDDTSWIYREDLDSLMPHQTLTESAVDYFVYGFMPRKNGLIFCRGTSFFRTMQAVKRTKEKAARDERLVGHIGKFDWVSYRFVILPVNGNSHWSFLVVENPLQGGVIRLYHVNSATEAHDTANVFSLMQWWLAKERVPETASVGSVKWSFNACPTKPQQQNSVDCGIYLLYFIEKISTAIMKDRPHTLRGSMDKFCSDKFNVENYRALLHQRIIRATNAANKKSKIL